MPTQTTHADPVICHCLQITQSTVIDCVNLFGANTVRDVKDTCGAGGGCMACRRRIQSLIQNRAETAARLAQQ
jgi:NAD(P)H-nitrite reductase large subunit